MVVPNEVVAAKRSLRRAMKAVLSALPGSQVASESASVAAQVCAREDWVAAKSVAAFCNMPSGELRTRPLLEAAFAARKRVFLPRVDDVKTRQMTLLEAYSLEDVDAFAPSDWGIPEPPSGEGRADALDVGVDFVVVPGVAFDADRGRLGHGAGFYDTWFARLDARAGAGAAAPAVKVGVALRDQVLPNPRQPAFPTAVPREAHDAPLDAVVAPQ